MISSICRAKCLLVLIVAGLAACSGGSSNNESPSNNTSGSNSSGSNTNGNNTSSGTIGESGQVQGENGQIEVHTTPFSIGVRWNLDPSSSDQETFTLEYYDDSASAWLPAAMALRVDADTEHEADRIEIDKHYWASSLVNLSPAQSYQLRATLTVNGETQSETITANTKQFLQAITLRDRYVVAKGQSSESGSGTESDPYRGLQTAANNALPGDTFHIAEGTYAAFEISVSGTADAPIAWIGPDNGKAIIDGQGTDRGIVTIENSGAEDGIGYNIIQGLTIQNGNWGVDAGYAHHIGVFDNEIKDVDYGFFNRRTTSLNHDQQVCGNTIVGQTSYPNSDRLRKGIRIKGTNNLTCYNSVRNFGDCISTDEVGLETRGSDIVGNDVSLCADDGIEIDHEKSNMRVWENRVANSKSAISVQPLIGGPAYIFRNIIVNVDERTIKLHNNLSGAVIMHNSGFRSGTAFSDDENSTWPNSVVKNNAFFGSFYAFTNLNMKQAETRDISYNAFGTSRNDGGNMYWIGNTKYPTLADVQSAGLLPNDVALVASDFSATSAVGEETVVDINNFDLALRASANAVNAGEVIDHLNKNYVSDGQPDMGAFEFGSNKPTYGAAGFSAVR